MMHGWQCHALGARPGMEVEVLATNSAMLALYFSLLLHKVHTITDTWVQEVRNGRLSLTSWCQSSVLRGHRY